MNPGLLVALHISRLGIMKAAQPCMQMCNNVSHMSILIHAHLRFQLPDEKASIHLELSHLTCSAFFAVVAAAVRSILFFFEATPHVLQFVQIIVVSKTLSRTSAGK
eukprot:scaffold204103_cov22-Tisochrysis_lutea.AAC.1